jgi:chemotaxis protein CheX
MQMQQMVSASPSGRKDEIVPALTSALKEIFGTMFGTYAEIVPYEQVTDTPRVSCIIGFGGKISGVLGLHFSKDMACDLAGIMLGMPVSEMDEGVRDAVGELSNMLAGGLKKQLCTTEDLFKISLPSVIEGREYSMHTPASAVQIWLGASAGSCRFKIQVVLEAR